MESTMNHLTLGGTAAPGVPPVARRLLLAAGFVLLSACSQAPTATTPAAAGAPHASPPPTATASPAATAPSAAAPGSAPACTTGGPASPSWPAPWTRSGVPAIVNATTSGDTLTLTFDHGTPAFQIAPTSSATFEMDPSGQRVVLEGSAGAAIHLTGFRGDVANFQGQRSIPAAGPLLRQVGEIGDFEGEVSWAAGLSSAGCAVITSSDSTLTFHFVPMTRKD
jgi:hypothetical protein